MRQHRNLDAATRQKISDGMKQHHQQRGEEAKRETAQKQSAAMKNYWRSIPTVNPQTQDKDQAEEQ